MFGIKGILTWRIIVDSFEEKVDRWMRENRDSNFLCGNVPIGGIAHVFFSHSGLGRNCWGIGKPQEMNETWVVPKRYYNVLDLMNKIWKLAAKVLWTLRSRTYDTIWITISCVTMVFSSFMVLLIVTSDK